MTDDIEFDWLISDTHFWHENIVKYSFRPGWFEKDYDRHNQIMFQNWASMVRPHENILHLGDLCFGKKADADREEMLRQLPGQKYLIKGNHDNSADEWYESMGFTVIEPFFRRVEETTVHFDHYPATRLGSKELSIHGHVHNNPYTATNRHVNLSCELWGLAPVPYQAAIDKGLFSVKD